MSTARHCQQDSEEVVSAVPQHCVDLWWTLPTSRKDMLLDCKELDAPASAIATKAASLAGTLLA